MKKQLAMTLFTLATLAANAADAGVKSKYGGAVRTAGNITMELVTKNNMATLYLEEKGKPLQPTGMIALMNVQEGKESRLIMFNRVGDKFEAKELKLKPSAKMTITVTNADQKKFAATFGGK